MSDGVFGEEVTISVHEDIINRFCCEPVSRGTKPFLRNAILMNGFRIIKQFCAVQNTQIFLHLWAEISSKPFNLY